MVDTITAIMVEILNFIGIATKEIKQGQTSKSVSFTNKFPLTKPFLEKYLRKLTGKNEIEDALKRLDRLTQEEARMAAAQLLKVTNTIENRVGGIADNVLVVDNKVAGIDDRVASVDERVAGVDERVAGVDERVAGVDERVAGVDERVVSVHERVAGVDEHVAGVDERVANVDDRVACVDDRVKDVDDKVKAVDDKLVAVIEGAQYIFSQSLKFVQLLMRVDGKEARGVIQQAADDVDQVKRSWSPNRIHAVHADSIIITGNQLRQDLRRWLSPPDPSTNQKYRMQRPSRGNCDLVLRGKYV